MSWIPASCMTADERIDAYFEDLAERGELGAWRGDFGKDGLADAGAALRGLGAEAVEGVSHDEGPAEPLRRAG